MSCMVMLKGACKHGPLEREEDGQQSRDGVTFAVVLTLLFGLSDLFGGRIRAQLQDAVFLCLHTPARHSRTTLPSPGADKVGGTVWPYP